MSETTSKRKQPRKRGPVRTVLRIILYVIGAAAALFALLILFLTVTEYNPDERTPLDTQGDTAADAAEELAEIIDSELPLTVVTWNIGYGALGDNADFFMDGGSGVKTADAARVRENIDAVISELSSLSPDLVLLQETDYNSSRSSHIDETALIRSGLAETGDYTATFSRNYKAAYVPYPVPPIGKVDSGLLTLSRFPVSEAERIRLPCPFSWPVRTANLKRCLAVHRISIPGRDAELVVVNLHLEAYDDGEGKAAQTRMLSELLRAEAEAGNYVIAGGDFNQIFSDYTDTAYALYPVYEGKWQPGIIETSDFGEGFAFLMDPSSPSCRSLDQPYLGADHSAFQYYLIDGFIVSDNIRVDSLKTEDLGFVSSDHNPVVIQIVLE